MTKWHRYCHCEARSAEAISSGNIVARPSNFVKILHIYHSKRVQEIAIRDTSYWRHLVREGVLEGERNSTIASLSGHLLWHGVDPDVAVELLLCWNAVRCRPPLSDDEVVRTAESIVRLHRRHAEQNPLSELPEE